MGTFFDGIAPHHLPALIAAVMAALLLPLIQHPMIVGMLGPSGRTHSPHDHERPVVREAFVLLGIASAVHIALPAGHRDGVLMTVGFLGAGVAYGLLAYGAYRGRGWRIGTALLVPANVTAYLIVVARGGEEADQVGIATALVELVVFGLAVVPRAKPVARVFGSIATVLAVMVTGLVVWITTLVAHQSSLDGGHGHEHLARAQAGVIMRPLGDDHHASVVQTKAAIELAAATKAAMTRYAKLSDAVAAGYQIPEIKSTGVDVHMEHPEFRKDGRELDPQRPENLVFAIEDGKATLLGVVFVLEKAGRPGPDPGGPITRWHAHNLCVSLVPPGIGIVTPYGGCPAFSLNLTTPEMMHIWIVDPPGGPYAEAVDEQWARHYHQQHGLA